MICPCSPKGCSTWVWWGRAGKALFALVTKDAFPAEQVRHPSKHTFIPLGLIAVHFLFSWPSPSAQPEEALWCQKAMLKRKKKNQKTHPKTQKIWSVTTGKTDAESALQMIFHLTFPPAPPCRLPCSLCTQPHRTEPPSSGKHLIHKKHRFTTLSKLPERMYLPTQHCLSEAQKKAILRAL